MQQTGQTYLPTSWNTSRAVRIDHTSTSHSLKRKATDNSRYKSHTNHHTPIKRSRNANDKDLEVNVPGPSNEQCFARGSLHQPHEPLLQQSANSPKGSPQSIPSQLSDAKPSSNSRTKVQFPRANPRSSQAVASRSAALVQRLADKQTLKSTQRAALSAQSDPRQRALQRLVAVTRAISAPSGGNSASQRRSYTLRNLASLVKQSLNSVMSDKELLDVLRVLETEEETLGCRGFVRFVPMGDAEAVVIDAAMHPSSVHLENRVEALIVERPKM